MTAQTSKPRKRRPLGETEVTLAGLIVKAFSSLTTTVRYAKCTVLCSEPMACPACLATVPANTLHECSKGNL